MGGIEWVEPAGLRSIRKIRTQQTAEARNLSDGIGRALNAGADALLSMQKPEGFWHGDLTADTSLEADYILLQLWLHRPDGAVWNPPTRVRVDKAAKAILERQMADGGFHLYPGGAADLNVTVKCYTALKLAGIDPDSEPMLRARDRILRLGGVQSANSYTKINLSLFGLFPRKYVPTVPPELVLLPGGVLYEMSSWTRSIIVPLSLVQACGGKRPVPEGFNLDELLLPGKKLVLPGKDALAKWFHRLDKVFKIWERFGLRNVRGAAIREAEHWMMDRTRYSEGLGAIYPAMMYFIMALDALGYPSDHPDLLEAQKHYDGLMTETGTDLYFQPALSPVWDTAIAVFALGEMGLAEPGAMAKGVDWLISKEVRRKGDWAVKRPDLEPSGWAFEFANEFYPDIDDTAMVLLALLHAEGSSKVAHENSVRRAMNWLLNMQSDDGGWAAFDVDNNWAILNKVPFADHNAMLDPTCPDITGRVIEALVRHGLPPEHPAIQKGVRYLLDSQEEDGSWYGRWGVNYVYGTFLALRGLKAAGADAPEAVQKAVAWLRAVQNADGGWGESCDSYAVDHYVNGPSTASQTAWGLLGLFAAGDRGSPAVTRGLNFLIETQQPDGTWKEAYATGTGFPQVFYMTYHLYRQYFPVLALAAFNATRPPPHMVIAN